MDDDELVAWLSTRVRLAAGYSDSRLSRERELLGRYYCRESFISPGRAS
jgi:hypothetical protein